MSREKNAKLLDKLELSEFKPGVLHSQSYFPDQFNELNHLIDFLKYYQETIDRHKCRICFSGENQDMLMITRNSSWTAPHYQEGKTIKYELIEGELVLYLFHSNLNPWKKIKLKAGNSISIPSSIPRTSLFTSETVVFREVLSGEFVDSLTVWPTSNVKLASVTDLLNLDRKFIDDVSV